MSFRLATIRGVRRSCACWLLAFACSAASAAEKIDLPPPRLDQQMRATITPSQNAAPAASLAKLLPSKDSRREWYHVGNTNTVFVFVHGIFSNNVDCWLHVDEKGVAAQYWPQLVRSDPSFEGASIYLGGFYTDVDSGQYEARQIAANLRDALRYRDTQTRRRVLDYRNIIFVTHSTGGIVVRQLLVANPQLFADKNVGLMLMASPSLGSGLADALSPLIKLYGHSLADELRENSPYLKELDQSFRRLKAQNQIPNLVGIERSENFTFTREWFCPLSPCKWVPNLFDPLVSAKSAGAYFDETLVLERTNHFTTVKPDGPKHPAHETLRQFYQKNFTAKVAKYPFGSTAAGVARISVRTPVKEWRPEPADRVLPLKLDAEACRGVDLSDLEKVPAACKTVLELDVKPPVIDQRLASSWQPECRPGTVCARIANRYSAMGYAISYPGSGMPIGMGVAYSASAELADALKSAGGTTDSAILEVRGRVSHHREISVKNQPERNEELTFDRELEINLPSAESYAIVSGQVFDRPFKIDTRTDGGSGQPLRRVQGEAGSTETKIRYKLDDPATQ